MAKKQRGDDEEQPELSFEDALAELEKIVRHLESGSLPLADSLRAYEQGIARLRQCQELLSQAQLRVDLLTGVKPDGEAELEPFALDASEDLSVKQAGRAARRGASRGE